MEFPIAESEVEIPLPVALWSAILRRFLRGGRSSLSPRRNRLRKEQRSNCNRANANPSAYCHCPVLFHIWFQFLTTATVPEFGTCRRPLRESYQYHLRGKWCTGGCVSRRLVRSTSRCHWLMTASGTELSPAVASGLIAYYLVYSIGVRLQITRHEQRCAN